MSIEILVTQAKQADSTHLLNLRRYCQHLAIRIATDHPERLFTLDNLRQYGVFSLSTKDSRWRTAITRELKQAGLFEEVDYKKSQFPGREGKPMMLWRLTSDTGRILDWIYAHPTAKPERSQGLLFE